MAPPVAKGTISVAFVRPSLRLSVRSSVAYITNNSRPKGLAFPNLEGRFPIFDATRTPVYGQKAKGRGHQGH